MNISKKIILVLISLMFFTVGANWWKYEQPDMVLTDPAGLWVDSRAYDSLADAVRAVGPPNTIGSREATIVVAKNETISANLTIPSNILLKVMKGSVITVASGKTLTINGPVEAGSYQIFAGAGTVSFVSGIQDVLNVVWWGPEADGSSDDQPEFQSMIDAAGTRQRMTFLIPNVSTTGYGINSAVVLPDFGGTARANWVFTGDGKLVATSAINIFETYDVTVAEPAHWTFGLQFDGLELDGNLTGTNGLKLHGCAMNVELSNLNIHEFTNAQIYLSRCLEVLIQNIYLWGDITDPTNTDYGIYTLDGTTHTIIGGTIHYCQTGYHVDGNLTEAGSGNDDGTDDIVMIGTVIEACGLHGIHVSAGDRATFMNVHLEGIGYNYAPNASAIKVSAEGGETPRRPFFERCTISTNGASDIAIDLDAATNMQMISCQDQGLKGGSIAAAVTDAIITSGPFANDFRPSAASNITDSGTRTKWIDYNTSNMRWAVDDSNYVGINALYGFLELFRDTSTKTASITKQSGDAAARWTLYASGQQEWGDGTNAADTNLYRESANKLKTDDSFRANNYFSGDDSQGMTGTCNSGANLTVKDGLIISCP